MRIFFFASLLCLMIRHVYHPMISYANAKLGLSLMPFHAYAYAHANFASVLSSPQIGT